MQEELDIARKPRSTVSKDEEHESLQVKLADKKTELKNQSESFWFYGR